MACEHPFRRGWLATALMAGVWLWAEMRGAETAETPPPSLAVPIDCQLGVSCWIFNYVDHDPSLGAMDYRCGPVTYDAHLGTDFAIRDLGALKDGVAVVAAAPGKVIGRRDGMEDVGLRDGGREAIKGIECGNGVRLDHGGGWTTQYCHLRKDSVAVKVGERVSSGQKLGLVGLSGMTNFPHVHFQLAKGSRIVDPFVGLERSEACGPGQTPLWQAEAARQLAYRPTVPYSLGFSATEPKAEGARQGLFRDKVLPRRAPMLILWADVLALLPGDTVQFEIFEPGGASLFTYAATIAKKEQRRFVYAGLPRKGIFWEEGLYRGVVRVVRPDGHGGTTTHDAETQVMMR